MKMPYSIDRNSLVFMLCIILGYPFFSFVSYYILTSDLPLSYLIIMIPLGIAIVVNFLYIFKGNLFSRMEKVPVLSLLFLILLVPIILYIIGDPVLITLFTFPLSIFSALSIPPLMTQMFDSAKYIERRYIGFFLSLGYFLLGILTLISIVNFGLGLALSWLSLLIGYVFYLKKIDPIVISKIPTSKVFLTKEVSYLLLSFGSFVIASGFLFYTIGITFNNFGYYNVFFFLWVALYCIQGLSGAVFALMPRKTSTRSTLILGLLGNGLLIVVILTIPVLFFIVLLVMCILWGPIFYSVVIGLVDYSPRGTRIKIFAAWQIVLSICLPLGVALPEIIQDKTLVAELCLIILFLTIPIIMNIPTLEGPLESNWLFIMSKDGRLIYTHSFVDVEVPGDLISPLLVALQDFMTHTIGARKPLTSIVHEDRLVLLEHGELISIALIVNRNDQLVRKTLGEIVSLFEKTFQPILDNWQGNLNPFNELPNSIQERISILERL